jgi:hypothetical protein
MHIFCLWIEFVKNMLLENRLKWENPFLFPSLSPLSPLGRRFPSYGPSSAPPPFSPAAPSHLPLSWASSASWRGPAEPPFPPRAAHRSAGSRPSLPNGLPRSYRVRARWAVAQPSSPLVGPTCRCPSCPLFISSNPHDAHFSLTSCSSPVLASRPRKTTVAPIVELRRAPDVLLAIRDSPR